MEGREIIFIPMSGGVKEISFWKELAERWQEKIKTLSLPGEIEPDDFTDPADEKEDGSSFYKTKCLRMKNQSRYFLREIWKRKYP